MEQENLNQETDQVEPTSSLRQVTPLSKYLAMVLFVILPFVGGYIGYTFTPEKIIEVEKGMIKEVEVERTEEENTNHEIQSESDWKASNSFSEVVLRSERQRIAMDLGSYSEGVLLFEIGAQRKVNDNSLYIDYLNFDENSGLVSLKDHLGKAGHNYRLMQIYKNDNELKLEDQIEDIILSDPEVEQELNEHVIWSLGDSYDPELHADLTYRSLCKIVVTDNTINNPTVRNPIKKQIGLTYDDTITESGTDFQGMFGPCGFHRFVVLDDLIIENFSRPTDATEPKILGDIDIDYNLSYVHSLTGEKVYRYDFVTE